MAFNRPGGSFSFQQEQVAHPYLRDSAPSTERHASASIPAASRSSSASHFPSSSPSQNTLYSTTPPYTTTRLPYLSAHQASVNTNPSSSSSSSTQPFVDSQFDIFEWHVQNQSCMRYFLDHAQYHAPVQAVAAFVNIQLPFQRAEHPIRSSNPRSSFPGTPNMGMSGPGTGASSSTSRAGASGTTAAEPGAFVTLVPYIRRLIATAFDFPAVLHGFFGDDWMAGIGPVLEAERRNYLFAAKSENWLKVKADYDMDECQTIPFLRPLQNVSEEEIVNAESKWSEWLAMQDWMLGPRAPGNVGTSGCGQPNIKREQD